MLEAAAVSAAGTLTAAAIAAALPMMNPRRVAVSRLPCMPPKLPRRERSESSRFFGPIGSTGSVRSTVRMSPW